MKWLQQFREWNRKLATPASIAVNVFILIFAYFIVVQVHQFGFRHAWWSSTDNFDLEEVIPTVIAGCIVGLIEVSDRRRAKETEELKATGKDRTMV
jgi:cytochrome bd-type quinol oxidase subunit 2